MDNSTRRWVWFSGILVCFAAFIAFVVVARSRSRSHIIPPPLQLTVSQDAQGRAQIGSLTVGNTNVRDAIFAGMEKLNVKPKIVVPNMTNLQQASNFIEQLNSMNKAGLFQDNRPNPYE
jgi:hypothetical protein